MRKCLLTITILLTNTFAFAQQAFRKNDLYLELFGNGIYASLNYERQLTAKPGLGVRGGLGYFSGDEAFRMSIPVGVNYLFGLKKGQSFLDLGMGATWSGAAGLKKDVLNGERDYGEHIWSFVPAIGYRRHTKGNFMWRASFTPFINKYRTMPYLGFSFGRRF